MTASEERDNVILVSGAVQETRMRETLLGQIEENVALDLKVSL
jgi:hypothetical protein